MTEELRKRIILIIQNWIEQNGAMPLSQFKRNLLENGKIPLAVLDTIKPKKWISAECPEFVIDGTNGCERIRLRAGEPSVTETVAPHASESEKEEVDSESEKEFMRLCENDEVFALLADFLEEDGRILLSQLPPKFKLHGIEWKELAEGKKLYEWLQGWCGKFFRITEDRLWLCRGVGFVSSTPVDFSVSDEQLTRNYVHRFCFCPNSSALLRQIKALTEDDTLSASKWGGMRTEALSRCLIGLDGGMLDDSRGEIPRMAFDTGVKTARGQDIYGILTPNTNAGAAQAWTLLSVAFPGQDSEEGRWLCNRFGLASQRHYGDDRSAQMQAVIHTLDEVKRIRGALLSASEELRRVLEEGLVLPESITAEIGQYARAWEALKKSLDAAGVALEAPLCIHSIQNGLNDWNEDNKVQDELTRDFEELARRTWEYFDINMLCRESLAEQEISAWREAVSELAEEDSFARLRTQLEPFRALAVLHAFDPDADEVMGEREHDALAQINGHFGLRLQPRHLRHTLCNRDDDMRFLELLPELDSLLRLLEDNHRNQAPRAPESVPDEAALLESALDGSFWKYVNVAYRAPNRLEKALMLDDRETIRHLVSNPIELHSLGYGPAEENWIAENVKALAPTLAVTPVSAAIRLAAVLGSECELIDRCLMLGVMQNEEEAVERLIRRYLQTDRSHLAGRLFQARKERISAEQIQELIPALVLAGVLSLEEAVESNLLDLLTESGIAAVESRAKNGAGDGALAERLASVYRKIQPTLLHHIVFLAPELQGYLLRPENAAELQGYPLDLSENGVFTLLRQDSFERGRSPLQIARRVYAFLGNWEDLARQFAMLAPETEDRADFLLKLYTEQGDSRRSLALLDASKRLRETHAELYADLLVREERYDELCEAIEEQEAPSTHVRMLWMLACLKTGRSLDGLTDPEPIEALREEALLSELLSALAAAMPQSHSALLQKLFPTALAELTEDELQRLVTANGTLSETALYALAKASVESCPALTVFCANLLQTDDFAAVCDEYLKNKYIELKSLDADGQHRLARSLQSLNLQRNGEMLEELLTIRLDEILGEMDPLPDKAKRVGALLSRSTASAELLSTLLARLDEQHLLCYAPLYRQLYAMAQEAELTIPCMRRLHAYRDQGDDAFCLFLCERYLNLESRDLLPDDMVEECEAFLLVRSELGAREQQCVIRLEERRGRDAYLAFAKHASERMNAPEDGERTEESFAAKELDLLCNALEDERVQPEDYLAFCAAFLKLDDGGASVPSETPTELASVLHALYREPSRNTLWTELEKSIPQERIAARARALFCCALCQGQCREEDLWRFERSSDGWTVGRVNAAWERCVEFCLSEHLDVLFFRAMQTWLKNINDHYEVELPWYVLKHYMATLQGVLDDTDLLLHPESTAKFPSCPDALAQELVRQAIDVFRRVEQDKSDDSGRDSNHNYLRGIVELAIRLDCEQILLEELTGELTGVFINLGLALICRLLLLGKFSVAMPFLACFTAPAVKESNYAMLVKRLSGMREEAELAEWLQDAGNRATLRFILPNGNMPDLFRLQTLIMSGYAEESSAREVSIAVIENILDCYPRDKMCYKALFIACKENYMENLPRIDRALEGLFKFYPRKGRELFTRNQDTVIKLLVILRTVMEIMGCPIAETESTVELVRGYSHFAELLDEKVSYLNGVKNEIRGWFVGVDSGSETYELLIHSLLGAVTGNWEPFFERAFRFRGTVRLPLEKAELFCTWGQLRGLLRVWRELPTETERGAFMNWIAQEAKAKKESLLYKHMLRVLENIVKKVDVQSVNWSMLRLPWEEHLVCLGNLTEINRPEISCCYKLMMAERPKEHYARDSFVLTVRLAQDDLKAQLLFRSAQHWFAKGDYALAGAAYEALSICHVIPEQSTRENYLEKMNVYGELYETWMRISHAFADANTGRSCSQHSCMNMMIALINGGYVHHFDRLRSFFKDLNLKLFLTVRRVLSSTMEEDEIINLIAEFRSSSETSALIAFCRFLLSRNEAGEYLILQDRAHIERIGELLQNQEMSLNEYKRGKYWIPLRNRPLASVFPELDEEEHSAPQEKPLQEDALKVLDSLPRFLSELDWLCEESDGEMSVADMRDAYDELSVYNDRDCSKRLHLAAQICSACMWDDNTDNKRTAIVRFGISYYQYYRNQIEKSEQPEQERTRIHRVMLDLALYGSKNPTAAVEVCKVLPEWFQHSVKGFASIEALLEDYSANRIGYSAVAQLLSGTEYADLSKRLLEVLDHLLDVANRLGAQSADLRGYQAAQAQWVALTPNRDWIGLFTALNDMLRQSINRLDQRPSLRVTIFNKDHGLQSDALYGEIENTGRAPAFQLELQANFPNREVQTVSAVYRFPLLRSNEKATFAIAYVADEGMTELEYILNLSYSDRDRDCTAEPVHGVLTLSPNIETPHVLPKFNTHQASSFTINEEGEIVSRDFKGRKSEIRILTDLMAGDDFSQYRSAIVQGIKRSGKTSLLNYLRTYIRAKKSDNAIPIFFDCQGISSQCVYKAFFCSVLKQLPLEYPPVESHPSWADFVARWELPEGAPDRDPGDMGLFFRQLQRMLDGRGIYLIIDEFAILLQRLNGETGFDALLQSLRGLQMDPDCFEAVHLILCGANHLLIYNRVGSAFNQMFQSYELIPVGQMLTSDIQEMIFDLLDQHPVIRFAQGEDGTTSPAIRWIEHYTGGLVWYTKLLVNETIKRVLDDGRDCVYPSDVCAAFQSICTFNNCHQLAEGCDDKDELVLDAMQALSEHSQCYVSIGQLAQLLAPYMNEEQLRKSLTMLTDTVSLLEQKAPNAKSYRFRRELYRRYFRSLESRFTSADRRETSTGDLFTVSVSESNIETADSDSAFSDD